MKSRPRHIADAVGVILADVYSAGLDAARGKPAPIFRIRKPEVASRYVDPYAIVLYEKDSSTFKARTLTHPDLKGIRWHKIESQSSAGHKVEIWIDVGNAFLTCTVCGINFCEHRPGVVV